MNPWWLASGGLCLITALVHVVAGHFDPVVPFLRAELEPVAKATLYACWHMVTVTLFASALALLGLGLSPDLPGAAMLAAFIAGLYVLYSIVFLVIGAKWFSGRLLRLPQWLLLLPVGVLAAIGAHATR
jgi:lipopolysaccharide export LptBFGC system permease protein LptF